MLWKSKGKGACDKKIWWWNKKVQLMIKVKRECYRKLPKCGDRKAYKNSKIVKKEVKKTVYKARFQIVIKIYIELQNREKN